MLIADTGNNRVRRVTADGTITTVAGTGMRGFGGDGGPAALAPLTRPVDVAALPSGGFIVATVDGRVRRVDERGMISSITDHRFAGAPAIAPLGDGEVLVTEPLASRVVRVSLDGSLRQLASGAGCEGTPRDRDGAGDGLRYPAAVAAGADGGVIVADSGSRRIVRIDDHRVGLLAGGGLRVPSDACGGRAAPMRMLEGLPPGPHAADSQYGGGLSCRRPGETRLFNVAFRYMRPRRPHARHRFRLRFEVTVRARVRLTAKRGGRRWKAPRRHSVVRSGRFWLGYPHGLRAGRYHFTLVADARNQRQCVRLKRRIRRARR
jgi:hypothetical protein